MISLITGITKSSSFPEDQTLYYNTDDDFLLIFLRPCKFYAKSALELMRRAADFKEKNAALLHNLLPSDERTALIEHNTVNVMKNRDHKHRRVLLVNCGKLWDPSKVTADQIFRIFYLIHELAIEEPETQVGIRRKLNILFYRHISHVIGSLR